MTEFMEVLDRDYSEEQDGVFSSNPHDFGFELDHFQKHAINCIKRGENVLVTAHTGSGKTVPAIFAIADSLQKNKKVIYTSPIKSLSNQKLFELKRKFPDVGIMTGDIKFNPDAQCVIMTTEILRNILYQDNSGSNDMANIDINMVDKVIFDEVHYINDPDRGRVWEECIILMPTHITMVMLSATIDKADEFATWIGTIKHKKTNLIPTKKRVVPLEHFVYLPENDTPERQDLIKIVNSSGNFINYNKIKEHYYQEPTHILVQKIVTYLKTHGMTPALFFVFSRKETERLAKSIHISLVTSEEASEITRIFNWELRKFRKLYETSAQYNDVLRIIQKGIAYHHSGLVPILKEVIEILFEKGLIKLLFATETFAVGVNAPTKTVVFPKLSKYSNNGFRMLRTDEYLQMAGRAGRRGLDKFGTVIVLPANELVDYNILKKMLTGKSPCIQSKFRLNYQFILKIINNDVHDLKRFLGLSLMAKDTKTNITYAQRELSEAKEKYSNGLSLSESDAAQIKAYYIKKEKMGLLKGNQWKRESVKLAGMKKEIRNFNRLDGIYKNYIELRDKIKKCEKNIEFLENEINNDIDRMLNYLYDNYYIKLDEPFNEYPREQSQIKLNTVPTDKINLDLKGIIASQISECNEIILTEIITNKMFLDLESADIIAILAAFIQEKSIEVTSISDLDISQKLKEMLGLISYIAEDFGSYEYNSGIDIQSDWQLYLSFIGPAYEWGKGAAIHEIYQKYPEVYEGTFIRNILRIYNLTQNIKSIAEICNQPEILQNLEGIEEKLLRDQVTTESLYISKV